MVNLARRCKSRLNEFEGGTFLMGNSLTQAQRLYQLISLPGDQQHALTVQVPAGVSAYDFTFG